MTDYPIIFSAPMIKALLDGRKTMTRRLAWGKPMPGLYESTGGPLTPILRPSPWQKVKPGDRLWVREAGWWSMATEVAPIAGRKRGATAYRASFDGDRSPAADGKWRPSIHMPRWASRLTLTVTATKIERLQDITAGDCYQEGIARPSGPILGSVVTERDNAKGAFRNLWTSLHGPDAWESNPEVVALSFAVERRNIDRAAA